MAGLLKKSTGLTGLAVAVNPHHTLTGLYGKILRVLSKMPADAGYRKNTEKIIQDRVNIIKSTHNAIEIEKKINCGQVEELIIQAENELILARKMLGWRPWEQLMKPIPEKQWDWPPAQIKDTTM